MRADGTIEVPLDIDYSRQQLLEAYEAGYRSIAIVLMHAYRYEDHELQLAALAKAIGFEQISVSHQV